MSIKRFLSLFYFNLDSSYPNYYHPLFIIPIILIGIFSTLGIISSFKNLNIEKGYLFLHLFLTISIFSLFFILPRYKMIILPIQFIFMNYFFLEFYEKNKYFNKIFKEKL
jgi:asparagine N-glycosylation enzyme membrane subunit Stt3